MFIGHYALGLASKRIEKAPSLAMLFIAVQFLDLLWPVLVLFGIETVEIDVGNTKITPLNFVSYPYSHSMLTSIIWGLLLGLVYFSVTKNRKGSLLLAVLVLSHWVLDLLTHRADLPLSPWSETKFGLGLWNYPVLESVLEFGMFLGGAILYFGNKLPKRKMAYWTLIALLLIIQTMNNIGPPPPSVSAVAWSANLMWLFVIWAWWIEKKQGS